LNRNKAQAQISKNAKLKIRTIGQRQKAKLQLANTTVKINKNAKVKIRKMH